MAQIRLESIQSNKESEAEIDIDILNEWTIYFILQFYRFVSNILLNK